MGRRALQLAMDVRDLDQVRSAVAGTVAGLGRLDILVNNAGVSPANPAEDVTEADFDLLVQGNVKGTFFASQAAGRGDDRPGLQADRQPRLAGRDGGAADRDGLLHDQGGDRPPHQVPGGGVGPPRDHRQHRGPDLHPHPGTEPALADPAFRAEVEERIAALHRIGEPMDVAGAVVFLASPAADLITGTTLLVDGGWTAAPGRAGTGRDAARRSPRRTSGPAGRRGPSQASATGAAFRADDLRRAAGGARRGS
jgi:hypothetical protein